MNEVLAWPRHHRAGLFLHNAMEHGLAEAHAAISDPQKSQPDAVHDLRGALKRWRALLQLYPDPTGDADRLRRAARDLAREFSGARDVQSAIDALDGLEKYWEQRDVAPGRVAIMRGRLVEMRQQAETAALDSTRRSRVFDTLDEAKRQVAQWPFEPLSFADIAAGLARTYGRTRGLRPGHWAAATPEELHELRQRVVEHRYQMEIVEPLWPRLGRAWVAEAQKLRTRLGRYQDLAVLRRLTEPNQPLAHWRTKLIPLIADEQSAQVTSGARAAARLFAERPKAFRRRLESMAAVIEQQLE